MAHDKYDDLLKSIKDTSNIDPKWNGTTDTLKAFSVLLVEVVRDLDKQAKINKWLQIWIVILTVVLTIFTAALLYFACTKEMPSLPETIKEATLKTQANEAEKEDNGVASQRRQPNHSTQNSNQAQTGENKSWDTTR